MKQILNTNGKHIISMDLHKKINSENTHNKDCGLGYFNL